MVIPPQVTAGHWTPRDKALVHSAKIPIRSPDGSSGSAAVNVVNQTASSPGGQPGQVTAAVGPPPSISIDAAPGPSAYDRPSPLGVSRVGGTRLIARSSYNRQEATWKKEVPSGCELRLPVACSPDRPIVLARHAL